MAVTREQIVAVALDLLDEAGLDGLTLRQLAGRLGIRAPRMSSPDQRFEHGLGALIAGLRAQQAE